MAREFVREFRRLIKGDRHSAMLLDLLDAAVLSVEAGQTTEAFADTLELDRGVSGYIYHTVPVAIHAWFRYPDDYREAVQAVIRCGGDTDTVAAITGALVDAARWPGGSSGRVASGGDRLAKVDGLGRETGATGGGRNLADRATTPPPPGRLGGSVPQRPVLPLGAQTWLPSASAAVLIRA